ncbi:hypothetical protein Dimus_011481 [Dionaea muscipula]
MVGMSLKEELDCGNFFDQIEDLLEFPDDDDSGEFLDNVLVEMKLGDANRCVDEELIIPMWSLNSNIDVSPKEKEFGAASSSSSSSGSSVSCNNNNNNCIVTDLPDQLYIPYEEIVQLEWLSTFVEDSFSGIPDLEKANSSSLTKDLSLSHNQYLNSSSSSSSSSPVSVLESSGSWATAGKAMPMPMAMPLSYEKRARSKRPRPATFNPARAAMHLIHVSSPPTIISSNADQNNTLQQQLSLNMLVSDDFAESHDQYPSKRSVLKKTTKAEEQEEEDENNNNNNNINAVRKCLHCEMSQTPQWRAGPLGPKTLCNACGVRYKSGRLFPEYRPAASPTFVPSLHSNSHRKVLQMRSRQGLGLGLGVQQQPAGTSTHTTMH